MMTVLDLVKKMALDSINRQQGYIERLLRDTSDLSNLSVNITVSIDQKGCEDPDHWPKEGLSYHRCSTCNKEFISK